MFILLHLEHLMWPMMQMEQVICLTTSVRCILLYHQSRRWHQPVHPTVLHVLRVWSLQLRMLQLLHQLLDHQLFLHHPNFQLYTSKLSSVDSLLVHLCCLLWKLNIRYAIYVLFSILLALGVNVTYWRLLTVYVSLMIWYLNTFTVIISEGLAVIHQFMMQCIHPLVECMVCWNDVIARTNVGACFCSTIIFFVLQEHIVALNLMALFVSLRV